MLMSSCSVDPMSGFEHLQQVESSISKNKGDQLESDLRTVLNENLRRGLSTQKPLTKATFLKNLEEVDGVDKHREDNISREEEHSGGGVCMNWSELLGVVSVGSIIINI